MRQTKTETRAPAMPHVFDRTPKQVYWEWHRKERVIENENGKRYFGFIPLKGNPDAISLLTEYWLVYPYVKKGQVEKLFSRNQIRHHGLWKKCTDILQTGSLDNVSLNDAETLKRTIRALEYGLFNGGEIWTFLPQISSRHRRMTWIWNYVTAYLQPETQEEMEYLWNLIYLRNERY